MTQDKQRLVAAILNFLANEKEADSDSLAVASQVISDTYRVNTTDAPLQLPSTHTLLDVFNAGIKSLNITFPEPVEDLESNPKYQAFLKQLDEIGYFRGCNEEQRLQRLEKAKEKFLARTQASKPDPATAEKFKTEGNEFLKQKKYNEAIESYKNAIKSDPTNAIYPANMAAAYLQINDLDNAEKCCKKAIEIDQKYTKSYTRLALIYQRRGKTEDAVRQYELALEQEPNNQEYRQKLEELRSSSRSAATRSTPQANPFGGMGGLGGLGGLGNLMGGLGGNSGGGMPDFGQLGQMLNNPQFMEMAMNMMQRPEMQSMVQNMMQGMGGQSNGGDDASNPFGGMDAAGIERVLQEPEVQNSPKLTAIFEECREKGISHALQYITDPEVSTFMRDYAMRQLQNLPADQNPFASFMPPSQNNGDEDNDNSGSMYS